jgi:hypothetical protein
MLNVLWLLALFTCASPSIFQKEYYDRDQVSNTRQWPRALYLRRLPYGSAETYPSQHNTHQVHSKVTEIGVPLLCWRTGDSRVSLVGLETVKDHPMDSRYPIGNEEFSIP